MEQFELTIDDNVVKTLSSIKEMLNGILETTKEIQKELSNSFDTSFFEDFAVALGTVSTSMSIMQSLGFSDFLISIGDGMRAILGSSGPLTGVLGGLSDAFAGLGEGAAVLAGPLCVVLAIVAALGAGFLYAMQTSEEFREKVADVFEPLSESLTKVWEEDISPVIDSVVESLTKFYEKHLKPMIDGIMELFDQLGLFLGEAALLLIEPFLPIIQGMVEFCGTYLAPLVEGVIGIFLTLLGFVTDNITSIAGVLSGFIKILRGLFNGDTELIMEGFKEIFDNTLGRVWKGIQNWYNKHIAGFFGAKKWDGTFKNIGPCLRDAFDKALKYVRKAISDWYNKHIAPWFTVERWAKLARDGVRGLASALHLPNIRLNVTWGSSPDWLYDAAKLIGLRGVPHIDFDISYRAMGGFVDAGQMFIAREAGPELVGTMGSRTAVMNNNQIVDSVSRGVYDAVASALGSGGIGGDWTIQIVDENGSVKAEEIITAIERRNRRDGKTVIALGV
ncbi:hypothetical protein NE604_03345 [Anaerofustis stercorihominis]|uniref:phage tail protein n=1 Tax=Anaerofustis stercorihominis TaxID=214853 RepID=UPI00210A3BE1|nr:hypothetical protein [Anaerofustis stercorihominis]MCQ4794675.1 hypothetical protein [Anaerofustis stercorihominis]